MNFWRAVKESEGKEEIPEFISTHPAHERRAENLEDKLPWALDIRERCNCYPLPKRAVGALKLEKHPEEKVSDYPLSRIDLSLVSRR